MKTIYSALLILSLYLMHMSGASSEISNDGYKGILGFLVENGCEETAKEYAKSLNNIKGYQAALKPINYTPNVKAPFKYYMEIKSKNKSEVELQGYANGIMSKCGSNTITEFDLTEKTALNNLYQETRSINKGKFPTKFYSSIENGKLVIYSRTE